MDLILLQNCSGQDIVFASSFFDLVMKEFGYLFVIMTIDNYEFQTLQKEENIKQP